MIARDKLKPFIILFVCMAALCLRFWITSRYPDLSSKAALGGSAPLSGLGFGPLYEIKPDAPVWEKLFYGTVNWLDTNRRGMTFAFLLSAFLLSMLPLIQIKRFAGGVKNAFLGLVMGTPLGLCVNCSAPVARALQASGLALETALALLISSPTMNVVVLTMAFTFFPFYIVAAKIALILLFVLLIIPFACHRFFKKEVVKNDMHIKECDEAACKLPEIKGWGHAVWWSGLTYAKNLLRIVLITGPLMVLAGFVGTAMITVAPWEQIESLSGGMHSAGLVFLIMLGIAVVGALLPAPMAFDVAISAALLQAGVPMHYVAVFLFTLGSYSIYAFFIVWQAVSLRVASFLLVVAVTLGLGMGASTFAFEKYYMQRAEKSIAAMTPEDLDPIVPRQDIASNFIAIKAEIEKTVVRYEDVDHGITKPGHLSVAKTVFQPQTEPVKKGFTKIYGEDAGIHQPYRISYLTGTDDIPHFSTSIATGDVHQDGWEDILLLGDHEVTPNLILYSNIGGKRFERQILPAAEDVVLVALAELDGDGWLDIVYATYKGKNFVIYNDHGEFKEENRKPLNAEMPGTTNSMGFADMNKDGVLEVLLGNWSVGPQFINYEASRDILLVRQGDLYHEKMLPGLTGETLSTLIWDFNGDGNLDVYIGNDFVMHYKSDLVLLGDGKNGLDIPEENFVKSMRGGHSTMSVDAGDIDNDLRSEYFIGHIAYIGNHLRSMAQIAKRQIAFDDYCTREKVTLDRMQQCVNEMAYRQALAKVSHFIVDACESLKDEIQKRSCEVHLQNFKRFCNGFNPIYKMEKGLLSAASRYENICNRYQEAGIDKLKNPVPQEMYGHLEVANESLSNIMLQDADGKGNYQDVGKANGVGYGGWTWNAKFADLDNDGWLDIYITNGSPQAFTLSTKLFFRNKGNGIFEDATEAFSLVDFSNTSSYSYVDYDHDGDLDIIAVPQDERVKIFRNDQGNSEQALQIELHDQSTKNTYGIGAKIIIHGLDFRQVRVIKSSGGYKSFDAPVAHFGLGAADHITKIEIAWPDGKKDVLEGSFKAGGRYKITRK